MIADEAARVRQSADPGTPPVRLLELARDPSVTVRASLAMNPALPPLLRNALASDPDERVRQIIGRKLAVLTPDLSQAQQDKAQDKALAALADVVAEAGVKARARIAELLSRIPAGPRSLILDLAQDPAVMVAEPVILFSPMLTDEDLVTLIAREPPPTTIHAVARRPKIGPVVSDAVVESADSAAIQALLRNTSAQIREATLDALAVQSEAHPDWQEPLVQRPHLSPRANRTLAEVVSGHLLAVLQTRLDLDPELARDLRAALTGPERPIASSEPEPFPDVVPVVSRSAALSRAAALKAAGRLNAMTIVEALRRNDIVQVLAMLAVKADVPLHVVERARVMRSAKAIVSLCWKADLPMQTAVTLQAGLCGVPPAAALKPTPEGGYPLMPESMRADLGLLGFGQSGLRAWIPRRLHADEMKQGNMILLRA